MEGWVVGTDHVGVGGDEVHEGLAQHVPTPQGVRHIPVHVHVQVQVQDLGLGHPAVPPTVPPSAPEGARLGQFLEG